MLVGRLTQTTRALAKVNSGGLRAAFWSIKMHLRSVYPELSEFSAPWTVASYVGRLVRELEDAKRARARAEAAQGFGEAMEAYRRAQVEGTPHLQSFDENPVGWRDPDPEPAPETRRSSPSSMRPPAPEPDAEG